MLFPMELFGGNIYLSAMGLISPPVFKDGRSWVSWSFLFHASLKIQAGVFMSPLRSSPSYQNLNASPPAQKTDNSGSGEQQNTSNVTPSTDRLNPGVPTWPLGHKKSFVKDLRDKYFSSSKESSSTPSSTPSKSLRPTRSMADGLRHAFSSKKAAEDAAALNVPGNSEEQGGRQITKKRSFFRSLAERSSGRSTYRQAIATTTEQTRPASPEDMEKALQQLRTPRQPEHPKDLESNCDGISLQLNPETGLPNGNKKLQGTLEEWHAEAMRSLTALSSLKKTPEAENPAMAEAITQMQAVDRVISNMLHVLKGNKDPSLGTCFDPSDANIIVNVAHNSDVQALAHIRIDEKNKTMHIEGLVSHPRNIFDLDSRGGVKGAGKKALERIKSEAIKHGCTNIELQSLTEISTKIYRKAGYEKDLDYWPDDERPVMNLYL